MKYKNQNSTLPARAYPNTPLFESALNIAGALAWIKKMKNILFLFLTIQSLIISAQENPFEKLKYDKVVAFEFNGNGNRTIDKILIGDPKRLDNRTTLDSIQIKKFEEIISKKDAYGQSTAACFDPHFAI